MWGPIIFTIHVLFVYEDIIEEWLHVKSIERNNAVVFYNVGSIISLKSSARQLS